MSKFESMREQAKEDIIEMLEGGYSGYYCDFHSEVFNTDYYIVGTYQAEQELESIGVFDAIRKVQEYENDNFGEVNTDLSDPEKLINMLYYIIGEEVLIEMMGGITEWNDNWNNVADDETNAAILAAVKE
jgi:hypothetical protein